MKQNDLTFMGEAADEKVLFVLRPHPWTLSKAGLWIVLLMLLLTAILLYFGGSSVTSWAIFILVPLSLYLGFRAWFGWSNSMYVLTNERVLGVTQLGWFNRSVKELTLDNITTISHDINGFMPTLLNYGDIIIQASGATEQDLTLSDVFDPYEVQQQIVRAMRKVQDKHRDRS